MAQYELGIGRWRCRSVLDELVKEPRLRGLLSGVVEVEATGDLSQTTDMMGVFVRAGSIVWISRIE